MKVILASPHPLRVHLTVILDEPDDVIQVCDADDLYSSVYINGLGGVEDVAPHFDCNLLFLYPGQVLRAQGLMRDVYVENII